MQLVLVKNLEGRYNLKMGDVPAKNMGGCKMEVKQRLAYYSALIEQVKAFIRHNEERLLASPGDQGAESSLRAWMNELSVLEQARNDYIGSIPPGSLGLTGAEADALKEIMDQLRASRP